MSAERLATGLVFISILVLASMAPAQSDTWWLLRAGQDIWQTGAIPLLDTYSYTAQGRHWPNHEWLTQVTFYAAHRVGGMPMLAALCAVLVATACLLSWRLLTGPLELRLVLFAIGLSSVAPAWSMRPQVFTMACLMLTCTSLARSRISWLPVLFLIWANFHGAVVLGLIALGAAIVVDAIRTRRLPIRLVLIGLSCAAATAVTPIGVELWKVIFAFGQRTRGQGIAEWTPTALPPESLPFWLGAMTLIIAAMTRWRHLDATAARLTAISLAFLPLAVTAMRNVPVFSLVAVPALSALLLPPTADARVAARSAKTRMNARILAAATLVGAVLVAQFWIRPLDQFGWTPFRTEAIAAISACPQPLYNTYDLGGGLIWFVPEQRVFIDSRYDPYSLEHYADNVRLEVTGDFDAVFKKHAIRCAVVPISSPTARRLGSDQNWVRVYADDRHGVFVVK